MPHNLSGGDELAKMTSNKDADLLEHILQYVNFSSPECRLVANKPLNILWDVHPHVSQSLGIDDLRQRILAQSELEQSRVRAQVAAELDSMAAKQRRDGESASASSASTETGSSSSSQSHLHHYFHLCKSFVHQMGLLSWEKRQSFNLLHKSSQLLRELKSLDDQTCRETHKIAVIYIGEGQEDKSSILSNESGSADYEDFVSALAWQVELDSHEGFMGGLQHNVQLKTAPYYANSISEASFILFGIFFLFNKLTNTQHY